MKYQKEILALAKRKSKIFTKDIASEFGISRQLASRLLKQLVEEGELVKIGKTRSAFYVHPNHLASLQKTFIKKMKNVNLKEHEVLAQAYENLPALQKINENIQSIFNFSFSEILNNAIEHSKSKYVEARVTLTENDLEFEIRDFGIGVFRNVMKKFKYRSELEAIQELLKGKTTTQPKAHSGEGIFFTSKIADKFTLISFHHQMLVDNLLPDVFVGKVDKTIQGTLARFSVAIKSDKHLINLFKQYQSSDDEMAFDKTKILVKLYTTGTIHVSRSQARRILTRLETFKQIVLDFDQVPTIGQAFADEIFRVFKNQYPDIRIETINTNEAVQFMIDRVAKE
ncbi:STAS-like domain-containing protein [Patescibacteria group bacterium]